jgi:hypothetical protein
MQCVCEGTWEGLEWGRTSVAGGHAVGVDGVGVVLLGDGLGSGEAGEGSQAEGEGGTHGG